MVANDICIPQKWQEFTGEENNKTDLFEFLVVHITKIKLEKQVITTYKENVMSTTVQYVMLAHSLPVFTKKLTLVYLFMQQMHSNKVMKEL